MKMVSKVILSLLISVIMVGCNNLTQTQENTSEEKHNIVNEESDIFMENITLEVNGIKLEVKLEKNEATKKLCEKLEQENVIVKAKEYGNFEKVGDLGFNLPTSDERIVTEFGDIVLYQGNQISVFYNSNTWSYTRLGKILNVSQEELKDILGEGEVTLVFSAN